ncbi:MAG: ABC transporter ATP-binding protein [Burkholderiaceae bacterium]|nr:ABC transporter ATP-binding protein [Burkholderiaceae bacterium]MBP6814472.1 ABC transporter ATP-binding protein [Burkholderiaceae bacterium]MBP7662184.1 ABC transporter ATP-binding protein [Burkholderiaceae bacterium]
MTTAAIAVSGLTKRFGGLLALDDVAFSAQPGQVLGIIGVNGAGKTTLMNCVCGIYKPDQGSILIDGHDTTGRAPHEVAHRGVGRTFQIPRVFRKMSLIDNLLVPVLAQRKPDSVLLAQAEAMLEQMNLLELRHNFAEELSGGQQKLLEMARMLMPDPRVVMLDEPFAGVHPQLCRFMIERIESMSAAGKTVLLISHDLTSIYRLSNRVIAMNQGRIIAEGDVTAIRGNPAVIEAYLGT